MAIKEGDKVPSATLKEKTADGIKDVKTDDLFAGRKVVLFGVPGAFTPTCSARHLPGFVDKAAAIKAKADEIVCVAVNDAFVMEAWGSSAQTDGKVRMLADGNAEFTRKLGLDLDASGHGMGTRSQRFAMIVDDGKVSKLWVEKPGEFGVSSAESVLASL